MTIKDITLKMFRSNFRRYLLYFLCSSFTVMIFFTYSTIFTNKQFMNPKGPNSVISSNIIAPSVIIAVFSLFFITYSHGTFNKFRKPEFGILMVLGMTNKDIRKIMFIENALIAVSSLFIGLIFGSALSRVFYFGLTDVIGIKNVPYTLTLDSYLYTMGLFTAIYFVVLVISAVKFLGYEVINLLKEHRIADRGISLGPWFGLAGIILIICSSAYLLLYNNTDSSLVPISMLVCLAGIYFLISNLVWFITTLGRRSKELRVKNLLFVSNIKYTFGKSKNVLFVITCLITVTILLTSLGIVFTSDSERLAGGYNPFHIAYAEYFDMNKLPDQLLDSIMSQGETPLKENKDLEFVKDRQVTMLSDENMNRVLGTDFHVKEKYFISLFQIMRDDGYGNKAKPFSTFNLNLGNKANTYTCQDYCEKILFNKLYLLNNDIILILNNNDYLQIKKEINKNDIGHLKLFNFQDWKKTGSIVSRLNNEFEARNKFKDRAFKPASRIEDYTDYEQSGTFLLFVLFFIGILFFLASNIMLHFKLLTEFPREKLKYKKIYKIGITKKEVTGIISKELKVLFFIPILLALGVGTLFSYATNLSYGKGGGAAEASLLIGAAYILFQWLTYLMYRKYYVNKLFDF